VYVTSSRGHPLKIAWQNGQIAQSVEQGIENPRVGGSIPSLATFFLLGVFGVACDPDPCEELCRSTANRLTECMGDWSMTWDDFDASSKANFRLRCVNRWGEVRSNLESRELEDAREQCQEARQELIQRASEDAECDLLRAMYVE
jgi:hypothetical protein